jgi:hypothetical protein
MARTNIPITVALPGGAATVQPAPTAIDQANGMNIALDAGGAAGAGSFPRPTSAGRLLLIVNHTTVSSKVLTFRAGVNPPAMRSALGDLNLTLAASTTYYIDAPDPARFKQNDGSYNVDFASGMTGTIAAVSMPPSFG